MALLPVKRHTNDTRRPDLTRLVDSWPAFTAFFGVTFAPVANFTDADDAYVVALDLPEAERDDIEVAITARRRSMATISPCTRRSRQPNADESTSNDRKEPTGRGRCANRGER